MEEQELCSEKETDLLTASCTGGKATDGTILDQSDWRVVLWYRVHL